MKKILFMILLLCSQLALANEYDNEKVQCFITGDEATITQGNDVSYLPKVISFTYEFTVISGSRKIVKTVVVDPQNVAGLFTFEIPKRTNAKGWAMMRKRKLGIAESMALLEKLGAIDVPSLNYGFVLEDFSIHFLEKKSIKSQVHFESREHDGLSYHVNLSCQHFWN